MTEQYCADYNYYNEGTLGVTDADEYKMSFPCQNPRICSGRLKYEAIIIMTHD